MKPEPAPLLVAIVGGSGAGKSWLADQLQAILGKKAARLSLDDFYLDRSHLPPGRRARINYDHPRAIDWKCVEQVLRDCLAGRMTRVPRYDFATHSRRPDAQILPPKPVILMDGLWLLRRPALRRMFALTIFIDCPARTRLDRRLARDTESRGRSRASVRRQFAECVEPMHELYVSPQARWARVRLRIPIKKSDLRRLAKELAIDCDDPGQRTI
ncbi:MAG: uridine kinase [Pedosphaera sp.]|nr:uridine kinase [Pedosphaera sp.]